MHEFLVVIEILKPAPVDAPFVLVRTLEFLPEQVQDLGVLLVEASDIQALFSSFLGGHF